jgi:hypothetical protein
METVWSYEVSDQNKIKDGATQTMGGFGLWTGGEKSSVIVEWTNSVIP